MAETDFHRDQLTDPLYALRWYLRHQPEVYASGNLLLLYDRSNRRKHVSPDLFVVRGVGRHRRNQYVVWEEGAAPDFVLEITSSSTWEEDLGNKKAIYGRLGIPEYYLFDPTGDYLRPPLRAYRLSGEEYLPLLVGESVHSDVLGLDLRVVDGVLRLAQPGGEPLPVPEEAYLGWQEAGARAEAEYQRAEAEYQRAEAEYQRAEAEYQRADAECQRAEAAEERVRRLEEELRRLRGV